MAGSRPPTKPISSDHRIAMPRIAGVTAKAKATWLKLDQLSVAARKPSRLV